MNVEDPLQQNIRRSAGLHALKQIHTIIEAEHENERAIARILNWFLRYGWILLVVIVALLARLMGVY